MKLLIDTHVVLWWQQDDRRLNAAPRKAIARADIVWVSAATACEVSIKLSQRRLRVNEPLRVTVGADDFTELPLTLRHSEELAILPLHHNDPFDRILIAQIIRPFDRVIHMPFRSVFLIIAKRGRDAALRGACV